MKDNIRDKIIYIRRIPKVGAEGELSTDTFSSGEDSDIDEGAHEGASGAGDDEVTDGGEVSFVPEVIQGTVVQSEQWRGSDPPPTAAAPQRHGSGFFCVSS